MGLRPTQGDENGFCQQPLSMEASPSPLSSRPERTRISYCAAPANAACAAFRKESRMKFPAPLTSTGNRGERSGGTCSSADLYWK
jgi:hypothetical protein